MPRIKLGRRAATVEDPDQINTDLLRQRYRYARQRVEETQAQMIRVAKTFNRWWKKVRYYEARLDKLPLHEAAALRRKGK